MNSPYLMEEVTGVTTRGYYLSVTDRVILFFFLPLRRPPFLHQVLA